MNEWLEKAEWDFDLESDSALDQNGLRIQIQDLLPDVRELFSSVQFVENLRRTISRDYLVPLMRGLTIKVNGIEIPKWDLKLADSDGFQPLRTSYTDGDVHVEVIAGVYGEEFKAGDDEGPAARGVRAAVSGWYVVCNGRVVLEADRSALTGWGSQMQRWHGQYNGFVGIIFFGSANPESLPMTTTKRDVDTSLAVYRKALSLHMVPVAQKFVQFTNDLKKIDLPEERPNPVGEGVRLQEVKHHGELKLPNTPKTVSRTRVANVNYSVPLAKLTKLAKAFGDPQMTYRDVGIRSFEESFDEFVGEQ